MTIDLWVDIWSFATVVICSFGIILGLFRLRHFQSKQDRISKRLSGLFLTDISIYTITIFFGFFTFLGLQSDWLLYPIRCLFLMANIYFAWRLVAPIR